MNFLSSKATFSFRLFCVLTIITGMIPSMASAVTYTIWSCPEMPPGDTTNNCTQLQHPVSQKAITLERPAAEPAGSLAMRDFYDQDVDAAKENFLKYLSLRIGRYTKFGSQIRVEKNDISWEGIAARIDGIELKENAKMIFKVLIKSSGWHNDSASNKPPECSKSGNYHLTYKVQGRFNPGAYPQKTRHLYAGASIHDLCVTTN